MYFEDILKKLSFDFIKFNKQEGYKIFLEEGCSVKTYGSKISKELDIFFNKDMKMNRDLSMLVLKSYFTDKKIDFCDPLMASGIREIRLVKKLGHIFKSIYCSDFSKKAVEDFYNNIKLNYLQDDIKKNNINLQIGKCEANLTILKRHFDFIEIDPFGSPNEFLDSSFKKIKNNGILSITATDTATLKGKYSKTLFRRYGVKKNFRCFCEGEIGIRNLITHCVKLGASYDKSVEVLFSYSHIHYVKIFLKIGCDKQKINEDLKNMKYYNYDDENQSFKNTKNIEFSEKKKLLGPIYDGSLKNDLFIKKMIDNLDLIKDKKEIEKLLDFKKNEVSELFYINIHKLLSSKKISHSFKFKYLIESLKNNKYEASLVFEDRFSIKTNCPINELVKIIKKL